MLGAIAALAEKDDEIARLRGELTNANSRIADLLGVIIELKAAARRDAEEIARLREALDKTHDLIAVNAEVPGALDDALDIVRAALAPRPKGKSE